MDASYFRAIHGKRATPKLKSWADVVKKPASLVEKKSPAKQKPAPAMKPPTPRPVAKVNNEMFLNILFFANIFCLLHSFFFIFLLRSEEVDI
jgi:hypothetical protein